MFQKMKRFLGALFFVPGVALLTSGVASAQDTFDVSSVTTMITAVGAAVAIIGAAVLIVKFGAKAWKWLNGAG